MAKRPPPVAADETPDGKASVILRDGPFDGAHDVLPDGADVYPNEIHIPAPGMVAIYQRKKPEGGLDTYRFARSEPVYRVED